jgi:TM2 domain-containing membrane protein YozV
MYCENCGALLTGGGKFCPECGAPVNIKIQNQYKKELEQGGMAFAYLPDEEPAAKTTPAEQARQSEETSFGGLKSGSFGYSTASDLGLANAQTANQTKQNVPDYGYSEDTIRAAQDELDRPSKAEEYKKNSTDWRDHVDSNKFREQNANGQPVENRQYTNQQFGYGQKQAPNMYDVYGTQYSDKSYIAAALLAFFLGGFGAHNFYLGYTRKAVIQLVMGLMTIFTFGLSGIAVGIWAFVEFILILTGSISTDGDGRPLKR